MPATSSSSFTSKRPVLVSMPCMKGAVPCQGCDQSEFPVSTSTRIFLAVGAAAAWADDGCAARVRRAKQHAISICFISTSLNGSLVPGKGVRGNVGIGETEGPLDRANVHLLNA